MAEGFARTMLPKEWKIYSAGTHPIGLHPLTIEAMAEENIDISKQYSKSVDEIPVDEIDYVVTLCGDANENCPLFPKKVEREHWPIIDPVRGVGKPNVMESFRQARDDIKNRVGDLAKRLKG